MFLFGGLWNSAGTVTIDDGRTVETSDTFQIGADDLCIKRIVQNLDRDDIAFPDITINVSTAGLIMLRSYACFEMPRAVISQVENHGIDMNALSTGMPIYYDATEQQATMRLFDDDSKNCPRRVLFSWSDIYDGSAYQKYVTNSTTSPVSCFKSYVSLMVRALYGETARNVSWKFRGSAPSGITMTCKIFDAATHTVYSTLSITGTGIDTPVWSSVATDLSVQTELLTTAMGFRTGVDYGFDVYIYSGTAGQEVRFHGIVIAET